MACKSLFLNSNYRPAAYDEWLRCEAVKAEKRADRQRRRDAAFARFERDNGVSARVLAETDGVKTVFRGQFCVGARAAGFVNHNG